MLSLLVCVLMTAAAQADPLDTLGTEPAPAVESAAPPAAPVTPAEPTSETPAAEPANEGEESAEVNPESTAPAPWYMEMMQAGALGLLLQGGFFMWPILLLGILAAGVIIERYRSLKMLASDSGAFRGRVLEMLNADQIEDAMELCNREQGPVAAILSAGLRKFYVLRRLNYDPGKVEEQVVKAMDDYGVHIVAALERHLPILATVSSVAPMIGFLGTVQGMIVSFQNIVEQMGETNIVEAAAAGIQVSLLTTCFGLIVGIPSFMAFNYFTSVINRFVLDVEESATELIEAVTLQMALADQGGKPDESKSEDASKERSAANS